MLRNRAFLCVAYFVFILVVVEVVLHVVGLPKQYHVHTHPGQFSRVADPEVLYVNAPATSIDFVYDGNPRGYFHASNLVNHVTNRLGFRGPEFAQAKTENTFRILFIGDSFTFGEGVYYEDTYPEQVRRLADQDHMFGARKAESINLGVGGYNTSQEFALVQRVGASLSPDALVVGYTLNDAEPYLFYPIANDSLGRRKATVPEKMATDLSQEPALARISRIYGIMWQISHARDRTLLANATIDYYRSLYADDQADWQKTKAALKGLADFGKQNKIPVVVVIFPALYDLDHDYPFVAVHQKIKQELAQDGLEYVDLLDDLSGKYRGPELWVHPTDQHPNEIVHRIAAVALAKKFSSLRTANK